MLYELLTGGPPFDAKQLLQSGLDAMRRTIRETEPLRPSTKLGTMLAADLTAVAQRHGAESPKLIHLIRGDLDWIVMKSLEKDRTRRYETANGLAMDIQRHLTNEPIVARPPSGFYKTQKIVSRHRLAFTALLILVVTLLLGVIGTTIGFLRSEKQRHVAEVSQQLAQQNFKQARATVGDLLAVADEDLYDVPGLQVLRVKLMRAALDRYQPLLEQSSADPELRAELGRLFLRYGSIAKEIGADYNKVVVPAFNSALAIQQQLVKEQPDNRVFEEDLGWTIIFSKLWWTDVAGVKTYQPQAVRIFERLTNEDQNDPFAREGLVWALGLDSAQTFPFDEVEMLKSERRKALFEHLVKEYPLSAEFRNALANQLCWYPVRGEIASDYSAKLARVSRANELRAAVLAGLE